MFDGQYDLDNEIVGHNLHHTKEADIWIVGGHQCLTVGSDEYLTVKMAIFYVCLS